MVALFLAAAVSLAATPATLPGVIAGAKGGEMITLGKGTYPTVVIKGRKFAKPVTFDARAATVAGLKIDKSEGVIWSGGKVRAPAPDGGGPSGYAMNILNSKNVTVREALITDSVRAIVMGAVSDIIISRNRMTGMTVDGINVGSGSNHVTIEGNFCETFNTGAAHADCVQGWSRPGRPVSDIVVKDNTVRGRAQGIYFGNVPTRKPQADPGFDRVIIENNIVETLFPNGVVVADCRNCVIRYNRVSSLPGAKHRAKVAAVRGSGVTCGNIVTGLPDSDATKACKK